MADTQPRNEVDEICELAAQLQVSDSKFTRITKEQEPKYANNAIRQIMTELKEFNSYSFSQDQVEVAMEGEDPYSLLITLTPNDGLYRDGYYEVGMKLTKEYPTKKPELTFKSPIFHPNIAYSGAICFSLLNEDKKLRITDYVHGMLWLLYHPNLFSRMNSDCPTDEMSFASLVRKSISGGEIAGHTYPRSKKLPSKVKEKKDTLGELKTEKDGKVWVWRLVGEDWVQFFEDEFSKIEQKQRVAKRRIEEDRRNMCFAGRCRVLMANGEYRRVDEIRRGDLVSAGSEGRSAEILCVVRTRIDNQTPRLVELEGGLLVTEMHPIRVDGQWRFPVELSPAHPCPNVPYIYSFVMKTGHVMMINGYECIGLGHNFTNDPVAAHPFLGSNQIIEALTELQGWKNGLVTLQEGAFIRSPRTQMLDGLDLQREIP
eukprot:CAMPEP_0201485648 /NCGR_PEP_ID=MMETSP0151_2-20130828/9746_1 /ASSEMBLY_ACC=CAM_ASM_000257 /TAXON_ID=200890 /ORGANISM="Paramoeba atlantica, Strain 621/1 / CCAP 1560/9" /LENGTH=428 /DNA_ID=CAMNT_0047869881 /DNA_START=167 /DNA_END=1453 /DNA_ORIENTATION=+